MATGWTNRNQILARPVIFLFATTSRIALGPDYLEAPSPRDKGWRMKLATHIHVIP